MQLNKKALKKPLAIAITIAATIAVASLAWYFAFHDKAANQNKDTPIQQSAETDKIQDSNQDSDNVVSSAEAANKSVSHEKEKELPQLYEGENTNTKPSLTGSISSKSIAGDYLIIRNTIAQFVDSGTCELTLTSGDSTIKRSAEIIQNPSSSSCAGFDIPLSELRPGRWSIEISISSESKAMTLRDEVNI